MMLDPIELKFFEEFSEKLSDYLANAGSNDYKLPEEWTPMQRKIFAFKVAKDAMSEKDFAEYSAYLRQQDDMPYVMDFMVWNWLVRTISKKTDRQKVWIVWERNGAYYNTFNDQEWAMRAALERGGTCSSIGDET